MSSLIPAAAAAAASTGATVAVMNPMDVLMSAVNTNPYFIGLMMLLLNLGGRFLALEITKEQEKFLSQPIVRRFFLFAVLFVATRNFVIAAGLAIIVIIILGYLFNENSELCLWRSCLVAPPKEGAKPQEGFSGLTPEEGMILKRLQDKQMSARQKEKREAKARENGIAVGGQGVGGQGEGEEGNEEKESEITASDIYNNAIQRLRMAFYTP